MFLILVFMKKQDQSKHKNAFWADNASEQVIKRKKKVYVCEAGISPSGTIHFGNFREVITVDIVERALKIKDKKTKFIYSWDDYDRLRKVPSNVPKEWEKYIGMPYSGVPDPFNCCSSYAEHFEKEFENSLAPVGIRPEFIRQSEKYMKCEYSEEIKKAMNRREKIREILNKYRTHDLPKKWFPLTIYCEKCKKDSTEIIDYDEKYSVSYKCECRHKDKIDFRKKGIVKLLWRVDWPMRWGYNGVDFEPGGKEHSTPGGSLTTSKEIVETVWDKKAPVYQKYEFIILKGCGGKMAGSLGNAISLSEVLEIYEPEIVRWMFAGTRPNSEFFVSFDLDVLKNYEDFDRCERVYFKKEKTKNEKEIEKNKRVYESSCVGDVPKKMPMQVSFRHIANLLQIYHKNIDKAVEVCNVKTKRDIDKLRARAKCALNWIEKYAPDNFKFEIQEKVSEKINLSEKQKNALHEVANALEEKEFDEKSLFEEFYDVSKKNDLNHTDFFKAAYLVLLNKERGPKLANFVLILGKEKVIELFRKA